jgi:arylsulfate sulfotransferase
MKLKHTPLIVLLYIFIIIPSCEKDDEIVSVPLELTSEINVQFNPYGIAPLTAQLEFDTNESANVQIRVAGDDDLLKTFSAEMEHVIPIMGLYPDSLNIVELLIYNDGDVVIEREIEIQTAPLPDYFPDIDITEYDPSVMAPGWNLMMHQMGKPQSRGIHTNPFMFDAEGDVRWYLDIEELHPSGIGPVELFQNGNILCAADRYIFEYTFLGERVNLWTLPENLSFHHDIIEKPNGNFLVAVDDNELNTIEDIAVEVDRITGDIVNRWDLREILDMDRIMNVNTGTDWFHMNALWYDENDDAIIFSGQRQGLVKVTNDNELVWIMSNHNGWGKAGVNGDGLDTREYLLDAVDRSGNPYSQEVQDGTEQVNGFDWNYGQHAPMILENGNIFFFDNGFGRPQAHGLFSRGVEMRVDANNMTVEQIWQYGQERGPEFQSRIVSDVDVLSNTNRLIMSGINFNTQSSKLAEVTYPSKTIAFEAEVKYKFSFFDPNSPIAPTNAELSYRMERVLPYSGLD